MELKEELKKAESEGEEVNIPWQKVMDARKPVTCKVHKFKYKGKGNNIQCDCGVGYQLPSHGVLKDGHVYIKDKLVI